MCSNTHACRGGVRVRRLRPEGRDGGASAAFRRRRRHREFRRGNRGAPRHQLRRMAGAGELDVSHRTDGYAGNEYDALFALRRGKGGGTHRGVRGQLDYGRGLCKRQGAWAQRRAHSVHLYEPLPLSFRGGQRRRDIRRRTAASRRLHATRGRFRQAGLGA